MKNALTVATSKCHKKTVLLPYQLWRFKGITDFIREALYQCLPSISKQKSLGMNRVTKVKGQKI